MSDETGPRFIAVRTEPPHIIRMCDDSRCHSYHVWVTLDRRDGYYEASQIVDAMNAKDARS